MSKALNPDKALIFRIVHLDNVASLLREGLPCSSSRASSDAYTPIGNLDLIEKRKTRAVPCAPFGYLPDYVPFYFTPFTPMLYNIKTGHNGVKQRPMSEIVILVSSLYRLAQDGVRFVFTDRHAYLRFAQFSSDLADLAWIDWPVLQARNFRRDDVDRFDRYQAEALVYQRMPLESLFGAICFDARSKHEVEALVTANRLTLKVSMQPGWFL